MVEKVIGNEVPFNNPTPLLPTTTIPSGIVAGIYVYQPTGTLVPTTVVNAWANGDMNLLKSAIESQLNITLLLAHLSCNMTQQDENYYRVTDYAIGFVFKTKTSALTANSVFAAILSTQWYSDMWTATGMQNATVQAYNLNVQNGGIPSLYLIIGISLVAVAAVGIGWYLMKRPKRSPLPPPSSPIETTPIYG